MTRARLLQLMEFYGIKLPTLDIDITDQHKIELQSIKPNIILNGSVFICDYLNRDGDLYKAIGRTLSSHGAFTITGYVSQQFNKNGRALPDDTLTKRNVRIMWINFLCGVQQ